MKLQQTQALSKQPPNVFRRIALDALVMLRKIQFFLQAFPNSIGTSPIELSCARNNVVAKLKNQQISVAIWPNASRSLHDALDSDFKRLAFSIEHQGEKYPISFSWPLEERHVTLRARERVLSRTIPGEPYSYAVYQEYLDEYRSSNFALTFKKGGWDCFRHIEIISAGCLPIMPDISSCPSETMAFYPKALMEMVFNQFVKGHNSFEAAAPLFYDWYERYLTSRQMAKYVLDVCRFEGNRVCFIDSGLEHKPDYMSMQLFVGMKRELGSEAVRSLYPANSAYSDWTGDSNNLHGMGFGNTRILETTMRGSGHDSIEVNELSGKDLIIFSDLERNLPLWARYQQLFGEIPCAFIWSSDRPPTRSQNRLISRLKGKKFFREIY